MWKTGSWVVRREVLSAGPWLGLMVRIISDTPDLLVSYIPERSPIEYPPGEWPAPDGRHPWAPRAAWQGHGCLMLQRPGESHAVWHFWTGPERTFKCWYINLQEPYRRTSVGYDTQDLELDFVVYPNGDWEIKDDELLDQRVDEGRFDRDRVRSIRAYGEGIATRLSRGERWWPLMWKEWTPDPAWQVPQKLPQNWAAM